ncbi:AAA family ATPase [Alkalihalobacillus sp. MEB130]|uniref:AAA family ATPase n=1 Tax=Alkalihalobacillus sp. MEB130 TaxID=2976704 RepID=UPI0028E079CA|nr:AAA family ATPase [Alkalihalobacillus sp. MEB130]MDT8858953.1 AAA family ATPase [Alkalihalobacillus sp. MEB130]
MNNIKAVRLENFQSHLDTFVEFSNGLNVIVGQSDSGKTAILRGIRWALYNQPRGTDFIRVSGDFVRVTVMFENETTIIRERTGSKNRYMIKRKGEEELVLEGFGIHVPEEVMKAHGMDHLRIDQDNELMIHLSQQLDGPFLLENTSTIRAKTLGRISGAHFLDMAIRDTTKDVSQLNIRMKQEQQVIDRLKEDLEPYIHLEELKSQLRRVDSSIDEIKNLLEKKEKLKQIQSSWHQIRIEETETERRMNLIKEVDNWERKREQLQEMVHRFVIYEQKRKQEQEVTRAISVCEMWLTKTKHAELANKNYEHLHNQLQSLTQLKRNFQQWRRLENAEKEEKNRTMKTAFIDSVNHHTMDRISACQLKRQTLNEIKDQLTSNSNQKKKIKQIYTRLPSVTELKSNTEQITEKLELCVKLQTIYSEVRDYQSRLEEGKRYIEKQKIEQEKAEKALQEALLAEGTCPTCGQSICKHA